VRLFAESGYDGTPTARIALQADIPKGLVFHYFPAKIDMLVAVVTERSNFEKLQNLPIDAVAGDVAQTLLRLAASLRDSVHLSPALRRIIFHEAHLHPEVRHRLTQLHTQVLHRARKAIDAALDGIRDGAPTGSQREAAAAAFASALLHDLNLGQLTGGSVDLGGIAALIAQGLQRPALAENLQRAAL
jgi:AcrR family transcriptional regulator